MPLSPGFRGRRSDAAGARLPPGQHLTPDFPVLSVGPTPSTPLEDWSFTITGTVAKSADWSWDEFAALPSEEIVTDIHCVTSWSKLDTPWRGVRVDTLLEAVEPRGDYVMAHCDGGYTTNLPLGDVVGGRAWIAYEYDGWLLEPARGGPARLLVPHLYFWKSAKWVRVLRIMFDDEPGFWEQRGYSNYGDPWREQRYWGD